MPDNSGWMGDPNDIKGKRVFEQSKKGANPDAAKKAADAKAKLAKSKAAKNAQKFTPVKPKKVVFSKIPASPTR